MKKEIKIVLSIVCLFLIATLVCALCVPKRLPGEKQSSTSSTSSESSSSGSGSGSSSSSGGSSSSSGGSSSSSEKRGVDLPIIPLSDLRLIVEGAEGYIEV